MRSLFYVWLLKQNRRDDHIGDLASDIIREKKISKTNNTIRAMPSDGFDSMMNHLETTARFRVGDTFAARSALVDAYNEFNSSFETR